MNSSNSGKGGVKKKMRVQPRREAKRGEPMEEGSSGDLSSDTDVEGANDPFLSVEGFEEMVKDMTARAWVNACHGLTEYSAEIAADIGRMRKGKQCGECKGRALTLGTLAAIQTHKCDKALEEYERRYLKALRDLKEEKASKKDVVSKGLAMCDKWEEKVLAVTEEKQALLEEKQAMLEERDRLLVGLIAKTERVREMEQEREQLQATLSVKEEQLQAAIAAREEAERERRRTSPPPSPPPQGEEMREIEMREGTPPPSPADGVLAPPSLGALEKWLEGKWEQLVARLAPPSSTRSAEAQSTGAQSGTWAKVTGRKAKGKSPPPVRSASSPSGRKRWECPSLCDSPG